MRVVGGGGCPHNLPVLQISGGALPEGLVLSPSGYFSGRAASPGLYQFILRAATDCEVVQQEYTIEVTGAPVLSVEPRAVEISLPHGSAPPDDPLVVQVRSSWGRMAYTADTGDAEWLRATPIRGETPDPHAPVNSDALELHVDPSRLPPGTYRVLMRLSAWRGANAPVVPVTLRVLPADGSPLAPAPRFPVPAPGLHPEPVPHPAPVPHTAAPKPQVHQAPAAPPSGCPGPHPSSAGSPHRRRSRPRPRPRPDTTSHPQSAHRPNQHPRSKPTPRLPRPTDMANLRTTPNLRSMESPRIMANRRTTASLLSTPSLPPRTVTENPRPTTASPPHPSTKSTRFLAALC